MAVNYDGDLTTCMSSPEYNTITHALKLERFGHDDGEVVISGTRVTITQILDSSFINNNYFLCVARNTLKNDICCVLAKAEEQASKYKAEKG